MTKQPLCYPFCQSGSQNHILTSIPFEPKCRRGNAPIRSSLLARTDPPNSVWIHPSAAVNTGGFLTHAAMPDEMVTCEDLPVRCQTSLAFSDCRAPPPETWGWVGSTGGKHRTWGGLTRATHRTKNAVRSLMAPWKPHRRKESGTVYTVVYTIVMRGAVTGCGCGRSRSGDPGAWWICLYAVNGRARKEVKEFEK